MKIILFKEAKLLGVSRYFTGKPCKRGHVAERFVCSNKCMECRREDKRKWRKEDPAKDRLKCRRWQKLNPDKVLANIHKRRARTKGEHSAQDILEIFIAQRRKCALCRVKITMRSKHTDHIVPLALGGLNTRSNIQLLCQPCNLKKGSRDPIDHSRAIGLLI
jgi:5-methylcytosine-specific restriction endonuclease McrA